MKLVKALVTGLAEDRQVKRGVLMVVVDVTLLVGFRLFLKVMGLEVELDATKGTLINVDPTIVPGSFRILEQVRNLLDLPTDLVGLLDEGRVDP